MEGQRATEKNKIGDGTSLYSAPLFFRGVMKIKIIKDENDKG